MTELAGFPKSVRNHQKWVKAKRLCTRWLRRLAQFTPPQEKSGERSKALGVVRGTRGEVRVPKATLVWMVQNKIKRKDMAVRLGVSRMTLNKLMKQHGLGIKPSEAAVLASVQAELALHPDHGEVMLWSEVQRKNPSWRVTRDLVRLAHTASRSPAEMEVRMNRARFASVYINVRVNEIWHADTNCKLAFAHLYIQAAVDGASKATVYAFVAPSNSAKFAKTAYDWAKADLVAPRHLRTDAGRETALIGAEITAAGGRHIVGPSTSNVPIERRWRDMGSIRSLRRVLQQEALHSRMQTGNMMSWVERCAVWLTYGYWLQCMLHEDMLAWNHHPVSTLSGRRTPYAAWSDGMYQRTHDAKYLQFRPSLVDAPWRNRFELDFMVNLVQDSDVAFVHLALQDEVRMTFLKGLLARVRQPKQTVAVAENLSRAFVLVKNTLTAAAQASTLQCEA